MEQFHIVILEEANNDILSLSNTIMYQYEAPITAFAYIQGLLDEIIKLKTYGRFFISSKIHLFFSIWFQC